MPRKWSPRSEMLTPQQRKFVAAYIETGSATEARDKAGYSANTKPSTLTSDPKIRAEIDRVLRLRMAAAEVTVDKVIAEYAKLAFSNPKRFFDSEGGLLSVHELDDDDAAALVSSEVAFERGPDGPVEVRKIKWADKKGALDSLGKYLGMFIDRSEVKSSMTVILSKEDQGVL